MSYNCYGDNMNRKTIDLSDIKENDIDKTSSFTDLMTRSERKNRMLEKEKYDIDDIENMIDERKKSTKDLTIELEKAKSEYKSRINEVDERKLENTQILEITRQMKFNFEENKKDNVKKNKKGISALNIIGEINLLCIGYYIYLLVFTNYQDNKQNYILTGGIIILLVLLFGLSIVTRKKISKLFNILNIITIIVFIVFNTYSLIN